MAKATFDTPGDSRGKELKKIEYVNELFQQAQHSESLLLPLVRKHDIEDGLLAYQDRVSSIELDEKAGGIAVTPEEDNFTKSRVITFIKEYHNSIKIDESDLVDSSQDIISGTAQSFKQAVGRVIDQDILRALIDPIYEQAADTVGDDQIIQPDFSASPGYKEMIYGKVRNEAGDDGLAQGTKVGAFTSDVLDKIVNNFRKNEIDEQIYCAMSPAFQEVLRTNADFKKAEEMMLIGSAIVKKKAWVSWKGVTFIPIPASLFPSVDNTNVGGNAPVTSSSAAVYQETRDINSSTHACGLLHTGPLGGTPEDTNRRVYASVNTTPADIAYFFAPSGVRVSMNPKLSCTKIDKLPHASYASQLYVRMSIGTTLMDCKYALGYAFDGTIRKPISLSTAAVPLSIDILAPGGFIEDRFRSNRWLDDRIPTIRVNYSRKIWFGPGAGSNNTFEMRMPVTLSSGGSAPMIANVTRYGSAATTYLDFQYPTDLIDPNTTSPFHITGLQNADIFPARQGEGERKLISGTDQEASLVVGDFFLNANIPRHRIQPSNPWIMSAAFSKTTYDLRTEDIIFTVKFTESVTISEGDVGIVLITTLADGGRGRITLVANAQTAPNQLDNPTRTVTFSSANFNQDLVQTAHRTISVTSEILIRDNTGIATDFSGHQIDTQISDFLTADVLSTITFNHGT